jgi:hypothetical protein
MPEFARFSQVAHDHSWSGSIEKTPDPSLKKIRRLYKNGWVKKRLYRCIYLV